MISLSKLDGTSRRIMDDFCRTCASPRNSSVSLFDSIPNGGVTYAEILAKFLSIMVFESDRLPRRICEQCANILSGFETFASGVKGAENSLCHELNRLDAAAAAAEESMVISEPADVLSSSDDEKPLSTKISQKNQTRTKSPAVTDSVTRCEYKHVSNRNRPAPHCLICFKSPKNLTKHLQKHSLTQQCDFFCPLCPAKVKSVEIFAVHMLNHQGVEIAAQSISSLTCPVCPVVSENFEKFLIHCTLHIQNMAKPTRINCVKCGQNFPPKSLYRHWLTHKQMGAVCPLCGKKFANQSQLNRHQRCVHEGLHNYKCPICGEKFTRIEILRSHQRNHSDPKPFRCESCVKTFWTHKQLYHHNTYHHTGGLRAACDKCGKIFTTPSVLRRHCKTVHMKMKEYQCDVCSLQFSTKQYLREHVRTHTNERPEVCGVCQMRFRMRANLKQHMLVHAERAMVCDSCGKLFTRKSHLRLHMECHHVDKKMFGSE